MSITSVSYCSKLIFILFLKKNFFLHNCNGQWWLLAHFCQKLGPKGPAYSGHISSNCTRNGQRNENCIWDYFTSQLTSQHSGKGGKISEYIFFHPTDFHIITFLKSKRKELQLNCLMHIKKPIVSGGQKKSLFVVLQNYYDQLLPTFLFYYVLELYYSTFQKCRKSCFCKIWW